MPELENLIVKYCVGVGSGLGKVKNKKSTWSRFCSMFDPEKVLVDTSVSFAQYVALDQDAKLEKKRAPGNWMAAHCREGRRKLSHIVGRSLVVFDLDYVTVDQLDHIRLGLAEINRFAWLMHTSRAHCPEKPRVRLIVPCDRWMNPEEYNAVTRLLALQLADDPEEAIEIPDLVSMRYNQTMFLPSTSRDQEYWREQNDGAVLEIDAFLAENPGWEDFAQLPYQEAEKQRAIADPNRKMEDPREKPGLLGAFCRAYSVEDAIAEFLPDIYAPGDSVTETRYTYLLGTGSNGAVVYDDGLFLHSNHGSDPIEGSANAWDLVRIHLFGHRDEKAPANTSPGNMPSFKAMREFAEKDKAVSAEMFSHLADEWDEDEDEDEDDETPGPGPSRETPDEGEDDEIAALLGGADEDEDEDDGEISADDWDEAPDEDDEPEERPAKEKKKKRDTSWMSHFRRKANGDLESVLNNAALICENDPRISGAVAYNEFTADPVALKPIRSKKLNLPSRALRRDEQKRGRRWEEKDDASIKYIMSADAERGGYETDFASQTIQEAVLTAAARNPVHPVKDMLKAFHAAWIEAGRPTGRIDQIPQTYLGCPDTVFHRESSFKMCLAAIARIMEPGCKYDQIIVLEGATGAGKSTFIRNLSGDFFSEFRVDLDRQDRTVEAMRGNWFLEMAEMAHSKKTDSNLMKDFLSAPADTVRLAYGKREMTFPRQSIMWGTSNENDYLTDPTSVRRYWVWRITGYDEFNHIDQARLQRELPLIWGEAYQAYLDVRAAQPEGSLHLGLESDEAIREQRATAEQSRRATATESIAEAIEEWLDERFPASEVIVDDSGFALDDNDERMVVRNMVSSKEAFEALSKDPALALYRGAGPATYGRALSSLPGWTAIGQQRRFGKRQSWFYRHEDGERWVEAPPLEDDDELDDLLA